MADRLKVLGRAQKEIRETYDFLLHSQVLGVKDRTILKLLCDTEDAITSRMVVTVFPQSDGGGNLFEDQAKAMRGIK